MEKELVGLKAPNGEYDVTHLVYVMFGFYGVVYLVYVVFGFYGVVYLAYVVFGFYGVVYLVYVVFGFYGVLFFILRLVMLADQFLSVDDFLEYHCLERKHDIADALCLLLFWIHTQRETRQAIKPPPTPLFITSEVNTFFTSLMQSFVLKERTHK